MAESKIEELLEAGESEGNIEFTMDQISQEWQRAKKPSKSKWMMGIYGIHGSCKSGILMDLRTEEEKKEGMKTVIIDIDQSCRSIWEECHDCDPNIIILDPLETIGKGVEKDISYILSYKKVIAYLAFIEEKIEKWNIGYVAIDGMDTFLKWCEFIMKDHDMGDVDVHNSDVGYNWGKRNQRYYRVLKWLKRLPTASFITAHLGKETEFVEKKGKNAMQTTVTGPNWHEGTRQDTADELYQIVRTSKRTERKGDFKNKKFVAEIEKWKGNVDLEEKKFLVLEKQENVVNKKSTHEWHGLISKIREYIKEQNKKEDLTEEITQENDDISDDELLGIEEDIAEDGEEIVEEEDIEETNDIEKMLDEAEDDDENEDEEEFECPECGKGYKSESWLEKHIKDKHETDDEENEVDKDIEEDEDEEETKTDDEEESEKDDGDWFDEF